MSLQDVPLKTEYRSLLDNVVNEFFLPVLKSKLNDPKVELEKELKSLNNKKERIRKAYIDSVFTEEEYKQELKKSKNKN